jgi:hypothetical protein
LRAKKRGHALDRTRGVPPPSRELQDLAAVAQYTPSGEHKHHYTPELGPGRWRHDATPCPKDLTRDQAEQWLKDALSLGDAGPAWPDHAYPEYVWKRVDEIVFEARLTNRDQGWYKGYPLDRSEWPDWLQ